MVVWYVMIWKWMGDVQDGIVLQERWKWHDVVFIFYVGCCIFLPLWKKSVRVDKVLVPGGTRSRVEMLWYFDWCHPDLCTSTLVIDCWCFLPRLQEVLVMLRLFSVRTKRTRILYCYYLSTFLPIIADRSKEQVDYPYLKYEIITYHVIMKCCW